MSGMYPVTSLRRVMRSTPAEHGACEAPAGIMNASVLIVTFRNPDLTAACLRSVLAETDGPSEVIVVDNASDDGTPDMVARDFPEVRLIRSPENLGFARANNLAAREARGEQLILLNPDTVVHDHALDRLVRFSRERQRPGLTGGRTLRPSGELDPSSCWGTMSLWSLTCFATGLSTLARRSAWLDPESLGRWQRDSVREVGVVTGCLLAVPRRVWDQLGGFDERFFMYGEDADLSIRAAAAGYTPMITPEATITHVVGASSSNKAAKAERVLQSKVTLVRKHWKGPKRRFGLLLLTAGAGARALGSRLLGRGATWVEVWAARDRWQRGFPDVKVDGRP